ncbi:hypothetical protein DFH27DRAFT_468073, partial [Peziza echinospora]
LLNSCILTLFICVWTAVHLNIPSPAERKKDYGFIGKTSRRVMWMLIALFAPEIVLYIAFDQFREARAVAKELNAIDRINKSYGYVDAILFALDVNGKRKAYLRETVQTLTPCGAIHLARFGKLPLVPPEEIEDKSKADPITKALACLQASWMIIQCIARKSNGLPITLLELHTIMHVVCALLMYLLWLKKPQNIAHPTMV